MQVYEDPDVLLESLEQFALAGLGAGEAVIAIATIPNLRELERRLRARAVDVEAARAGNRYLTFDASQALSRFMVGGWPDEELFRGFIGGALQRARAGGARVRAFGEMVAMLWSQGRAGATIRLEELWNELLRRERFSLYCAYPRDGFKAESEAALQEICALHTRVIAA